MNLPKEPDIENNFLFEHVELLTHSYRRWTGEDFFSNLEHERAKYFYHAPFAILSHNTATDPIFNYANLTAQSLFEMPWNEFVQLPSRLSAEAPEQDERDRLLHQVTQHGYINNYSGIRISRLNKRFYVDNVVIWNLFNTNEIYCGQAAVIKHWKYLD